MFASESIGSVSVGKIPTATSERAKLVGRLLSLSPDSIERSRQGCNSMPGQRLRRDVELKIETRQFRHDVVRTGQGNYLRVPRSGLTGCVDQPGFQLQAGNRSFG